VKSCELRLPSCLVIISDSFRKALHTHFHDDCKPIFKLQLRQLLNTSDFVDGGGDMERREIEAELVNFPQLTLARSGF
jgi:hypothetical protein